MNQAAKPFVKMAGGKHKLLRYLRPLLPATFGRYWEPFVGGGALFWSLGLAPGRAVLSDTNLELVTAYCAVRDNVEALISQLTSLPYSQGDYYRIRDIAPETLPAVQRAARAIYLNKTCFNGLQRVNRAGRFNVPFGRYDNPLICDDQTLWACRAALQGQRVLHADFEDALLEAAPDDVVYCDPPYVKEKETSFVQYDALGFGMPEQERLARAVRAAVARGVFCLVSNSDTPAVRELYGGFKFVKVERPGTMNSNPKKRGPVRELAVVCEPWAC